MADDFREMTRQRQQRHKEWNVLNRKIIEKSGTTYAERGEAFLFRDKNKPKADFYPSTGRWKSNNKMYSGGAEKFLEWYAQQ